MVWFVIMGNIETAAENMIATTLVCLVLLIPFYYFWYVVFRAYKYMRDVIEPKDLLSRENQVENGLQQATLNQVVSDSINGNNAQLYNVNSQVDPAKLPQEFDQANSSFEDKQVENKPPMNVNPISSDTIIRNQPEASNNVTVNVHTSKPPRPSSPPKFSLS